MGRLQEGGPSTYEAPGPGEAGVNDRSSVLEIKLTVSERTSPGGGGGNGPEPSGVSDLSGLGRLGRLIPEPPGQGGDQQ